jgi:predicted lipoprotein with Yx(FWY)xxD motif
MLIALMATMFAASAALAQDYGSGSDSGANSGSSGSASTGSADQVRLWKTSLGMVLSDGKGMTLYAFTPDKGGVSTCYDECEAAWPPLVSDKASVGSGLSADKLGTTKRKDGKTQVTYNNWPLYYFASDTKPGDVKGQNVKGIWFVLGSDGKLVKNAAANGTLPYTGPEDRLLPIAGALLAAGLAVLVAFRRAGGRHARRSGTTAW